MIGTMSEEITFTSVTPYLRYPDGEAAAQWLTRVLGFGPSRSMPGPDSSWAEGEIAIGEHRVDISAPGDPDGTNGGGGLLIVGVTDVDAQYRRIRDAGVEIDAAQGRGIRPAHLPRHRPVGVPLVLLAGRSAV